MEKLTPSSYIILPPWQPIAAQKIVAVLSSIFLKNPPIAAPLFQLFGQKNSTRELMLKVIIEVKVIFTVKSPLALVVDYASVFMFTLYIPEFYMRRNIYYG